MCERDGKFELNKGNLYSLESDLKIKLHISSVSISNGLAWSLEDKKFYYIDSLTHQVTAYDYDAKNGTIGNILP